jgi:iron(II)-dependent oxidoreductase
MNSSLDDKLRTLAAAIGDSLEQLRALLPAPAEETPPAPETIPRWTVIPAGEVTIDGKDIYVPTYELHTYCVTVDEYRQFLESPAFREHWAVAGVAPKEPYLWEEQLAGDRMCPVTGVSWYGAKAYAHWAGVRLPTDAEWVLAAAGPEGRKYAWGYEEPDPTRANYGNTVGHPTPPGRYPKGVTPQGVHDMSGNVWEWLQ